MMPAPMPPAQGWTRRLPVRLAVVLAIALFPVLVLSVYQATSLMNEARARSEAALMGATMRALGGETRLIEQAQGVAAVVSRSILPLIGHDAACVDKMRLVAEQLPYLSLAAYIPVSGLMTCSSSGRLFDYADNPLFQQMIEKDEPSFIVNPGAPVSGTSILGIVHPVFDERGDKIGVVSLSIPHKALAEANDGPDTEVTRPLIIMTFDRTGSILTSSTGLDDAQNRLPADRALKALAAPISVSFSAKSRMGNDRIYSVVELVPNQVYALGSWPADGMQSLGPLADLPPVLFPTAMWLASLFVAYVAVQQLVIRHIRQLGRAIRRFAGGHRIVGHLNLDRASLEIRELADAFERMTETILHDEAQLEDTIHHKEVLLREVHHRVKNNLQLIASIINMQMRQARTPEAKGLMKGLQERVISLATIHRGLYQTSGLTDISANELLPDIVNQIVKLGSGPGRRFSVTTDVDDIRLTPDQAVPLALLLTEAMTNALKYASNDTTAPWIKVELKRAEPMRAHLRISNSVAGPMTPPHGQDSTGLGSQLLGAFVQQLGGTIESGVSDDTYHVSVPFALRPLSEAEARHDRTAPPPSPEAA